MAAQCANVARLGGIMTKVKITAVRQADYRDLQSLYENPIEHTCDVREGDTWISDGVHKPDGLCESAWESIKAFVRTLGAGGGNFFDGWMKNPHSALISCNDGFRPVSFLLEAMDDASAYPYLYETHCHTMPVSKCASASARDTVEFYKRLGYAGVFITNHFIDSPQDIDSRLSYEQKLRYFFSGYEEAKRVGDEMGIDVFCGAEIGYGGTHFLVYGLDEAWFLAHPEIDEMQQSRKLQFLKDSGALVIQAHPCRESSGVDHIRLFPRRIHGTEIYNANRTDFENEMAELYAKNYALIPFAGSDNHVGPAQRKLGGMRLQSPVKDEREFAARVLGGEALPFCRGLVE